MENKITITVNGKTKEYESGISYEKIAKDFQNEYDAKIVLVKEGAKLKELHKQADKDSNLEFITVKDKIGFNTYRRSCTFLLVRALHDVLGEKLDRVKMEFTVSKGTFCNVFGDFTLDEQLLRSVQARMDDLVAQDILIWKTSYNVADAIKMFSEAGMKDKERLFRYRRASKVNVYSIGDLKDYYYGYMVPSTGYLTLYDLELFDTGFVLRLPTRKNMDMIPEFKPDMKLYQTMKATNEWGEKLGLATVGALNDRICAGGFEDLMMVQEALMEGNISKIAGDIAADGGKKFVMIAGPSSSGKTSFSYRLSIQLRAHGMNPYPIGLDNYFKNREDTPRDENGNYNFEYRIGTESPCVPDNSMDTYSIYGMEKGETALKIRLKVYRNQSLKIKCDREYTDISSSSEKVEIKDTFWRKGYMYINLRAVSMTGNETFIILK